MDIFDETKLAALAKGRSALDLQMAVLQFFALSETAKEMGPTDNVEGTVTLVTEQARAPSGAHWTPTLFDFNSRSDGICRWLFSDKFYVVRGRTFRGDHDQPVHSQETDVAEITMSDNGIGCDSKNAQRIFRIFERIHGRAEIEGDGVGLAVCEKIVERHGGMIVANAEPETGATFIVTMSAP